MAYKMSAKLFVLLQNVFTSTNYSSYSHTECVEHCVTNCVHFRRMNETSGMWFAPVNDSRFFQSKSESK